MAKSTIGQRTKKRKKKGEKESNGETIKARFDKLTYDEKLKYIERAYPHREFIHTVQVIPDESPPKFNEEARLKKSISIRPSNDDEANKYIDWRAKLKYEVLIKKYEAVVATKQYQSEKEDYINSQLEAIRKREVIPDLPDLKNRLTRYFEQGYDRLLKNEGFISPVADYIFIIIPDNLSRASLIDGMAYYKFEHHLRQQLQEIKTGNQMNTAHKIQLHWNGNKNQLYDVMNQLKDAERISNSYPDIAHFLKFNFDNFNNTALATIQTELQRSKRPPKARRVNLNLDNTDKE